MAKTKKSEQNMTLLDHLIELRNRLLISFCAFIFLFFLCFIKFTTNNQNLADIVYNFLQAPLASQISENGGRMIYTALHEGFFTQVKVAFFIYVALSLLWSAIISKTFPFCSFKETLSKSGLPKTYSPVTGATG